MTVLTRLLTRGPDGGDVRAMPVVLRVERELPDRTALLEAAAWAAVALCLDERAQEGGDWHDEVAAWLDSRIRKVSRRARGAHWAAVQDVPGVTVEVGGASARALVPGVVGTEPKVVSRLQISGTELPPDTPGAAPDGVPVLWVNPVVEMTVGKLAAQVGHGSMLLGTWAEAAGVAGEWDGRCAVRTAGRAEWAALVAAGLAGEKAVAVRDAGFTEVDPGTVTVVGEWR